MPIAEHEAWEIATTEATGADGTVDEDRRFAVYKAEYERRIAERRAKLTSTLVRCSVRWTAGHDVGVCGTSGR